MAAPRSRPRVVSLTVHKTNLARRRQRQARHDVASAAKRLASRNPGMVGYAVFVWREDGGGDVAWDCRDVVPCELLGDFCKRGVDRSLSRIDARDIMLGADEPPED
jgi:hypothetical protein